MTFIRKYRLFIGLSVLFVVLLCFIIFLISNISESDIDKYGKRLDGIEDVKITDLKVNEIEKEVLTNECISTIEYRLDGKLIKFFIEIKKETIEINIENILTTIINKFTEEEKKYYDFEIFITSEEKNQSYPMIAYKHCKNETFTITKKEGSNNEE